MKKQIITKLCGLLCATASMSPSFSQTTAMLPNHIFDAKTNFDYTLAVSDYTPAATAAVPFTNVSTKVQNSFTRSFADIKNAQWYKLNKSMYLATFTNTDGRTTRAFFSKNGFIDYVINKGDEKSLPKDERHLIKAAYVDYNIGKVSEVNAAGTNVWVVNLQDADNLIIARIADNGLDELAHYQTHAAVKATRKGTVIIPK